MIEYFYNWSAACTKWLLDKRRKARYQAYSRWVTEQFAQGKPVLNWDLPYRFDAWEKNVFGNSLAESDSARMWRGIVELRQRKHTEK